MPKFRFQNSVCWPSDLIAVREIVFAVSFGSVLGEMIFAAK